jgi:hypothetical protein
MRLPNDRILAEKVKEIDIILGGHDHQFISEFVGFLYLLKLNGLLLMDFLGDLIYFLKYLIYCLKKKKKNNFFDNIYIFFMVKMYLISV